MRVYAVSHDNGANGAVHLNTHLRLCRRSLLSPRRSLLRLSLSLLLLFLSLLRLREEERRWWRFSLSLSAATIGTIKNLKGNR